MRLRSFVGFAVGWLLSGCGSGALTVAPPFVPSSKGGLAALRVVDPTPDLQFQGIEVQRVELTAFDAEGNQIYGPSEETYDEAMHFEGLPRRATRVRLEYQRGPGFALAVHEAAVDFLGDADGLVEFVQPQPQALGVRNTFTVRIENRSGYPDDQVFVSVNGKDAAASAFFFLQFGPNDQNQMQPFGGKDRFAEYSTALSQLKPEGPHQYSFQCPYDRLVSGRIFLSFGEKLRGIGLTDVAQPLALELPAPTGTSDEQTVFEFMELSATADGLGNYTLFANTSVVDFFSLGIGMALNYHEGGQNLEESVGFVADARKHILAEFDSPRTPPEFRTYIRRGQGVVRILSPVKALGANPTAPLSQFLEPAIEEAWNQYAVTALSIPDNLSRRYFYQYLGDLVVGNLLSMVCTQKPAGDIAGGEFESLGERCNLPRPTSRIVFFCDDDAPLPPGTPVRDSWKNDGSQGHKRLCSLLLAAFNRGVASHYSDWGSASRFYTRPDGRYNHYAKIMHQFARDGKVYGFGYDDVYGQDTTLSRPLPQVNQVLITIPEMQPL